MTSSVATSELLKLYGNRTAQMVAAVQHLVAHESPSGDMAGLDACALELSMYFERTVGVKPELLRTGTEQRPHLCARLGDRTRLLLIGHFDTVYPPGTLAAHPTRIEGDRLYGLGALDMKAGLVIMAELCRWLVHQYERPDVTVLFNSDEEIGSTGSGEISRSLAVDADAVLVFEYGNKDGSLRTSNRGVRWIEVELVGRGGHAAYSDAELNPVEALSDVIVAARALHDPAHGLVVTPTVVEGSAIANAVPDRAVVQFDIRGRTEAQLDEVTRAFATLTVGNSNIELRTRTILRIPAFERVDDNRAFAYAQSAAAELGLPTPISIEGYGASDNNQVGYVNHHTLEGLGGWGGGQHNADKEYLAISSLAPAAALATAMVVRSLASSM